MRVCIPRESHPGERRVAASPESIKKLISLGFSVSVQRGAGTQACYTDEAFAAAGAEIVDDPWSIADLILKVRPPLFRQDGVHEADLLNEGSRLISFYWPAKNGELTDRLKARNITAFGMDQVPRISRAQKMDALSSMANISGYRAVVEAAAHFGSFFCGQMTAAGKVAPAKVLIIGAGVAGLAALGAAKGMGAIVRAFDTRAAVRDQIKSLGGEFLEVKIEEDGEGGGGYAKEMSPAFIAAEMELFRQQAREVDIVITTALIPGRPAPKLWLRDMVELMKPGSVIVDLAAESGGNCDVTLADQVVVHQGVIVLGPTDLPSQLATTASQLYAQNLVHFLTDLGGAEFKIDFANEVTRGSIITHAGEVLWPPPKVAAPVASAQAAKPAEIVAAKPAATPAKSGGHGGGAPGKPSGSASVAPLTWISVAVLAIAWLALRGGDSSGALQFAQQLTIFALSCFVGFQVIWSVAPALHTPLMSVTNAISGIIVVGGILHLKGDLTNPAALLALGAVLFATINIGGGFLVTRRMLRMFRRD